MDERILKWLFDIKSQKKVLKLIINSLAKNK